MSSPRLVACLAGCLLLACNDRETPQITLVLDANQNDKLDLRPVSAFAEYVQIEEFRHELRVTLASFETSCEEYRAPADDETVVTLAFMAPPSVEDLATDYAFAGVPDLGAPLTDPIVIPKVRSRGRSHLFQPGGIAKLSKVVLEPHGSVEGALEISYPGDAEHPATRLAGRFSAWMCRVAPAPKR